MYIQPDLLKRLARFSLQLFEVDKGSLPRVMSEPNVFGDGHVGNQVELLIDNGDTAIQRVNRASEIAALAIDFQAPLVRAMDSAEDLEEGALTGSVLATQGMNGAAANVKRDVLKGLHTAKALGDAANGQQITSETLRPSPSLPCSRCCE